MKILVQRVIQAQVEVDNTAVGIIGAGVVVFVGITHSDTKEHAAWLGSKLIQLRIFEDDQGKINHSLVDRKGSALIISQFTLYADCNEGRRPSFSQAAPSAMARPVYDRFVEVVEQSSVPVKTGVFGAVMKVSLVNDGPFTLLLER